MRNLTAIFILMMVAMLIVSCSMEESHPTTMPVSGNRSANADWTVMYYGAGNYAGDLNGSESRTMKLLRSLQQTFPSERVRVAALVASRATGGSCRFYEVVHGSRATDSGDELGLLSDWGSGNTASAEMFSRFVDSVITRFPADKYLLVLGGHGEGWRGAFLDETHGNAVMPIYQMREVLTTRLSGDASRKPFELMLWTAPRMGMVEVAHEFRNLANYMVATPELTEFDHSLAAPIWLRDLQSESQMDGALLGRLILRAVHEVSQNSTSPVHCVLYDLSKTESLGRRVHTFATELSSLARGDREGVMALGDSLRVPGSDDPFSVDLAAYAEAVARQYSLTSLDELPPATTALRRSAELIRDAVDQVIVEMRPPRGLDQRAGLMIHFPRWSQEVAIARYDSLEFYRTYPSWFYLLRDFAPVRRDPVDVSGLLRFFVRSQIKNPYLFLLTGSDWSTIVKEQKLTVEYVNATGDSARFTTEVAMTTDSLRCLIGVYLDADSNGFGTGDYWAINRNSSGYVWHNLKPGDQLPNLEWFISNRR